MGGAPDPAVQRGDLRAARGRRPDRRPTATATPACATSPGTVLLTVSGAVARPMVIEVPTGVPLRYVLQLAGAPPLPQGVLTGGYHGNWIDAVAAHDAVVSTRLPGRGGRRARRGRHPADRRRRPARSASRCAIANWLAAETAGQCGPCKLGLPAAARGLSDVLNGGGPAALEALREVTRAVKRPRGVQAPGRLRRLPGLHHLGVHGRPRGARPGRRLRPGDARGAAAARPGYEDLEESTRAARSWPSTGRSARATGCARTSSPS